MVSYSIVIMNGKSERVFYSCFVHAVVITYKIQFFVLVVVLCANPNTVRNIMLAADELNMVSSGEYVFFNIELFSK